MKEGINTYKMIPNMTGFGKTFFCDYKGYPTKNKNQIYDLITGQNGFISTQYLQFGPLPNLLYVTSSLVNFWSNHDALQAPGGPPPRLPPYAQVNVVIPRLHFVIHFGSMLNEFN